MRKRPFLLLACMLGLGIWMRGTGAWRYLVPVPCFLLIVYFLERRKGRGPWFAVLLSLSFLLGVCLMQKEIHFRSEYLPGLKDGQEVRLMGEIVRIEKKNQSVKLQLTDCVLNQYTEQTPCNDVMVYASSDDYSVGQILVLSGTIQLFDQGKNEGSFDAEAYYQSMKIDFGVKLMDVHRVLAEGNCMHGLLWRLRDALLSSLRQVGDSDGILSTMLLGDKERLNPEIKDLYKLAGISHVLAISGLHVSLLGMGAYRLLRKRWGYLLSCSITAVFMYAYGVMTGFGVSTRRAVGMLLIFLLGDYLGKSYDMLSALGAIVMVMLWDNPFLIYNTAFLLSVGAVLGVGMFQSPGYKEGSRKKGGDGEKSRGNGILISLGIQWVTLPLLAYSYFEIPTYAVFLNLVVLALVKYLVGLGGLAALAGIFVPALGRGLFLPCRWILALYDALSGLCLALPGSRLLLGRPTGFQTGVYYVVVLIALWCIKRRITGIKMFSFSLLLTGILFIRLPMGTEVDILDVGQGDGTYIRTGEGLQLFVDGGSSDVKQVGTYRILPFLKCKGVREIDYWFLSHADIDHTNGFLEILETDYPVRHLVVLRDALVDESLRNLVELAEKKGISVLKVLGGDTYTFGEVKLHIWSTAVGKEAGSILKNANDLSLVFCYEENGFKALFAGDISSEAEHILVELMSEEGERGIDLYKVNHHGSKYSSSEEWLSFLSPRISVISCGEYNRYGHPHAETLQRLKDAGSTVWTTPAYGEITIKADEKIRIKGFLK